MNIWCTYTVNSDGVYTLTEVVNGDKFDVDKDNAGQKRDNRPD